MALQKTIQLSTGEAGDYIRMTSFRWDRGARDASAMFALFKSSHAAASGATPQVPIIAKLRLRDAKFDQYLGTAALDQGSVVAQLYAAARAEPVVSDYGPAVLADATDA